jgi:uncharacterized protein YcbX
MAEVAWLTLAPVKALGLVEARRIELERFGVAENRRFFLVDERGKMVNAKRLGSLLAVRPAYDAAAESLALDFPDGSRVEGKIETGEPLETGFSGRPVEGRIVRGPWSEALSAYAGTPLRLVGSEEPGGGVDRGTAAAFTLLSTGSLQALAAASGVREVDPRRFRMLIGIAGVEAHAEDGWLGRRVRVGQAVVVPRGNVGRCAVTTRDPDSGERTLDTLAALAAYRPDGTEPLPFGVWGEVAQPGVVALGDPVEPLGADAAGP